MFDGINLHGEEKEDLDLSEEVDALIKQFDGSPCLGFTPCISSAMQGS